MLSKENRKFLRTHLRLNEGPWGLLYLLFKVHKNRLKTRTVVSYCGKLLHPLGQLITERLQPLAKMHKFYFQDSFTLKKELDLQKIPSNACLFICGATSLYSNIKTGPALHHIGKFALENKEHMTVPPAVLMDPLHLLMTNNVFQFGDTYWLQKVGVAMGAPPAPPWATIFFGIHEETVFAQFGHKLQFYRRFIDDVLEIWLVDPNPFKECQKWTSFIELIQDYYGLEWIFKERSKTVNYMDMTISICEDRIITSLYEEAMNLYLYTPPQICPSPRSIIRTSIR